MQLFCYDTQNLWKNIVQLDSICVTSEISLFYRWDGFYRRNDINNTNIKMISHLNNFDYILITFQDQHLNKHNFWRCGILMLLLKWDLPIFRVLFRLKLFHKRRNEKTFFINSLWNVIRDYTKANYFQRKKYSKNSILQLQPL